MFHIKEWWTGSSEDQPKEPEPEVTRECVEAICWSMLHTQTITDPKEHFKIKRLHEIAKKKMLSAPAELKCSHFR